MTGTPPVRRRLLGAALPPASRSSAAAREIGWMVEELRVSLFAQTIGTQGPVSERRILTAIGHLT